MVWPALCRGAVMVFCLWSLAGVALAAPVINSISPAQGEPGTQVLISGANFADASQVKFNNTLADFTVLAADQILAVVPVESVSGPISVVGLSGTAVTRGIFLVAPRIFEFLPRRSATNTVVTIFGENFESASSVQFNGVEAPFQIVGATQITALVPFGATNGPIRVASLAGVATTLENFTVTGPAPIIDSFSPEVVAPGETVVIEGANFIGVTGVQFNGLAANFSATAATQIRATVPASATTGPIRVVSAQGTANSTNALVVTRAPVITGFSPSFGIAGVQVIISGINFQDVKGVSFNGISATGFGKPAENQINASVPANATTGPIRVTNAFGVGVSAQTFLITRAPIITNLSLTILKAGDILTVSGANFIGASVVKFNGKDAVPSVVADSQLHVTVPVGAKSGAISVVNSFGTTASAETVFIITEAPYLIDAAPPFGPRGTEVILSGANFLNATGVRFNGVNASFAVTAATQIRALVPAPATSGRVTVITPFGTSTNDVFFFVPPRLTSFTPTNGVVGDQVTIKGTNFFGDVSLVLGGGPVPFEKTSSNTLTATIAAETRSGLIAIGTPGGAIISTNRFTVLPNILSFAPTLGPVGTQVTIAGTSFFDVNSVSFNGATASFTIRSSQEIVAVVPAAASPGPIRVITPDGTATSTNAFLVTGTSDLTVRKTASISFDAPPQTLAYAIVVDNRGPSIQTGVTVSDTLPAGATFVSASSPRGPCSVANGVVTCPLGIMTNGTAVELMVQARVDVEGVFTNRVKVQAIEPDSNSADNSAEAVTMLALPRSRMLRIEEVAPTNQVVISWPASPVNFLLQAVSALNTSSGWTNVSPPPVITAGRNRVTNDVMETTRFYRLSRDHSAK